MADVREEIRLKAFNWCRDYLGGTWRHLNYSDFQIRDLRGVSSHTEPRHLVCSFPQWLACANDTEPRSALLHLNRHPIFLTNRQSALKGRKNEPREVLLRVYGEIFYESDAPLLDSIIFSLLSEREQGPRLYGVFTEGRLEQYIPSRCLTREELSDPKFSTEIAEKLAKFHRMDLPLCKVPRWLNQVLDKWTNIALSVELDDPVPQRILDQIRSHDLIKQLQFVKGLIANSKSPVVFCHNDCQEGNILLAKGSPTLKENSLVLIDFEYSSYNYRASDMANHFCEWAIDNNKESAPFFSLNPEDFPTEEQQLKFIRTYLAEFKDEGDRGDGDSPECNRKTAEAVEKDMLREIQRFTPIINFLWTTWSCVQAKVSHTTFGYMEYGLARFNEYLRTKEALPSDM
ncbi:choline kinase alpha-like isoform X1 [Asterias rubens]|uniref:choline kinase alpha-like isoform X1 n=1 Tax=Asterias rubens TaxID=7604 RepID=UPI00145595CE|nr:choline kinase alpha-like isoform X1 [Asterias rubens]